ncbi:hypothetical protein NKDENANG_01611 [Candidatus Entotheonellaceae bacterium PAL068K]
MFDPHGFPKIVGDLAESWEASDDSMTYTFKVHQGVKFHDGSELIAADIAASWNKIVLSSLGVFLGVCGPSCQPDLFQKIPR